MKSYLILIGIFLDNWWVWASLQILLTFIFHRLPAHILVCILDLEDQRAGMISSAFSLLPAALVSVDWWLMRRSVWLCYLSFWILRPTSPPQSLRCLPAFIQNTFITRLPHAESSCAALPPGKAQMTCQSLYQLNRRMKLFTLVIWYQTDSNNILSVLL